MDVREIDGASYNGVDEVAKAPRFAALSSARRDRLQNLHPWTKSTCCLKTPGTAFLKTLEEPPAHVKFIFATNRSAQKCR